MKQIVGTNILKKLHKFIFSPCNILGNLAKTLKMHNHVVKNLCQLILVSKIEYECWIYVLYFKSKIIMIYNISLIVISYNFFLYFSIYWLIDFGYYFNTYPTPQIDDLFVTFCQIWLPVQQSCVIFWHLSLAETKSLCQTCSVTNMGQPDDTKVTAFLYMWFHKNCFFIFFACCINFHILSQIKFNVLKLHNHHLIIFFYQKVISSAPSWVI